MHGLLLICPGLLPPSRRSSMPTPNPSTQRERDPTRRPFRTPQDDDFPPLPPGRRLPSVGAGLAWVRRNTTTTADPETDPDRPSSYIAQISDALSSLRDTTADDANPSDLTHHLNDPNFRFYVQQIADRDYLTRYQDLLNDTHNPNLSLLEATTATAVRFHEQQQNIRRELSNSFDLMMDRQDNNSSHNYHTSWLSNPDSAFVWARPRSTTASRPPRATDPLLGGEDEDDLDAVRTMWNRRAQHVSSPFSPPHPSTLSPTNMSPGSRPPDYSEDNRRVKRRKLDSDRIAPSFKGFRYGKYGQVEPGELTMEIVSCDGGLYSNESSYACENILKNDNSVYCTKSNKCNIVLRHQGATVFSLKELVIKAPASSSYNAPVREGMVFVSMNQDDLLNRTAQYQIQYAPSRSHGRSRESRTLAPIISIRHNEDGTVVTRAQTRSRRMYGLVADDEDENHRTAQIPPEFTTDLLPFNITTECSDDEDSDDDHTPRVPLSRRAPNRIGVLPFESEDSDDGNPFANDEYGLDDVWAPSSRRRDTQNMTLTEALDATQRASHEAVRSAAAFDLMAPHAKFYIEKDKSKCTIRFDPPVSGRFILLKMWSPHRESGSNIDIQAVVAKGFAGPRYFPSVQLR